MCLPCTLWMEQHLAQARSHLLLIRRYGSLTPVYAPEELRRVPGAAYFDAIALVTDAARCILQLSKLSENLRCQTGQAGSKHRSRLSALLLAVDPKVAAVVDPGIARGARLLLTPHALVIGYLRVGQGLHHEPISFEFPLFLDYPLAFSTIFFFKKVSLTLCNHMKRKGEKKGQEEKFQT